MINIIVATTINNAIGYKNKLIHYDKKDLAHFKALTIGSRIIMGRKTFESLPNGALPDRENVVITKNKKYEATGITVVHSLEDAIKDTDKDVFIIGGESIYKEALNTLPINKIYMTRFLFTPKKADTYFPILSELWIPKIIEACSTVYNGCCVDMYFQEYEKIAYPETYREVEKVTELLNDATKKIIHITADSIVPPEKIAEEIKNVLESDSEPFIDDPEYEYFKDKKR